MDFNIYVLYDSAKNIYGEGLMVYPNDATAMRDFENEYLKPNCIFQTHPQDFILYCIGTFYSLTGEIISHNPERVCCASDFKR